MTKKGQLLSTIIAAVFIAIMIPVAIFATAAKGVQVSNHVHYYVTDIEGAFYYAITGNRLDNGDSSSFDVGYDPFLDEIRPQTVFTAGYEDAGPDHNKPEFVIRNGTGGLVRDQVMPLPHNKGLQFDAEKQDNDGDNEICYYFVFINRAMPEVDDERSIYISTRSDNELPEGQVATQWSYMVKTTTFTTPPEPLNINGTWTTQQDNPEIFDIGIKVPPFDGQEYYYIILKYSLTLVHTDNVFDGHINLTITLRNYANI